MATKKAAKKEANKLYAISSSVNGDLGYSIASMEEVDRVLSGEWSWYDSNEVVTVYELVPVKKYKMGPVYVEVK